MPSDGTSSESSNLPFFGQETTQHSEMAVQLTITEKVALKIHKNFLIHLQRISSIIRDI
jgi:glutamine cyclotransferase